MIRRALNLIATAMARVCALQRPLQPSLKESSMNSNRRSFVIHSTLGASALICAGAVRAQAAATAPAMVQATDAQAQALGYVADATKVDKAKFARYAAGQNCTNCAVYQGKPADAAGPCPLFPGKQVAGKGWCSAWAKKA
jgi:phage I-like protein